MKSKATWASGAIALITSATAFGQLNFYDTVGAHHDAMQMYYDNVTQPASLPTYSAAQGPLQDISSAVGTVSGLQTAAGNIGTTFDALDSLSGFGAIADNALAGVYNLPQGLGSVSEYSFGNFVIGGQSFNFTVNFGQYADSISLVRTAVLLVMSATFLFVAAETMRGYL
jgi:hypothetical protein